MCELDLVIVETDGIWTCSSIMFVFSLSTKNDPVMHSSHRERRLYSSLISGLHSIILTLIITNTIAWLKRSTNWLGETAGTTTCTMSTYGSITLASPKPTLPCRTWQSVPWQSTHPAPHTLSLSLPTQSTQTSMTLAICPRIRGGCGVVQNRYVTQ